MHFVNLLSLVGWQKQKTFARIKQNGHNMILLRFTAVVHMRPSTGLGTSVKLTKLEVH